LNDFNCINTFEGHLSSVLKIQWIYYGTHIISTGADGLVKFWNLKTSECLNTLNAHEGKIWALDVSSEDNPMDNNLQQLNNTNTIQFITGGTDSKITLWTDISASKETEDLKKEEETILKKEKLRILNDNKEYYEAMKLSLELNHRSDFMETLKNFVDENLKEVFDDKINLDNGYSDSDYLSIIIQNRKYLDEDEDTLNMNKNLSHTNDHAKLFKENLNKILKDSELRKIIKNNMHKILEIVRDFNIKTTNFLYAQILLKLILLSTNYEDFINEKKQSGLGKKNKGLKNLKKKNGAPIKEASVIDYMENFEIMKSYSEKHLERINREIIKSYLIDYVLEKMKII
jgi:hypothetical protein